jgi:catalase (peroxidase I)
VWLYLTLLFLAFLRGLQFYRNRQSNANFQWTDAAGVKQPVSLADILVAGAAVAVKQCSNQALNLTVTMGRIDAVVVSVNS